MTADPDTGVAVGGLTGLGESLSDRVAIGIVAGLLIGKPIGILAATWLVARVTKAELDSDLSWLDVLGLSVLAGVGFTVSLVIGELAFGAGSERDDHVKVAILAGSVLAAIIAGLLLRSRNRIYDRQPHLRPHRSAGETRRWARGLPTAVAGRSATD